MSLDWSNLTDAQFLNIYGYERNPPPPKPFCQWKQPYNAANLASYAQARALRDAINSTLFRHQDGERPMGGGILPEDDENPHNGTTGIFVEPWDYVDPGRAADSYGVVYQRLLVRFANGCTMNVGSILDYLSRNARAQSYAVGHIAGDVENNARTA